MGNLSNEAKLFVHQINKNNVNERSLIGILEQDSDFTENVDYFSEDTLELGFKDEAERVAKEIFDKCKKPIESNIDEDEYMLLQLMVRKLFEVEGFIGRSSYYGDYDYEVVETDFEYVIVIATII